MAPNSNIFVEKGFQLDESHQKFLENLGETKRLVVIFIKWNYGALTNLENFKKPADSALIGYFAEHLRPTFPEDVLRHYDLIIWFKAEGFKFHTVPLETLIDSMKVQGLDEFLFQALKFIPVKKIKLIEGEESLVITACHNRKKFNIQGPSADDVEPFRNKVMQKFIAESKNVPTAKFAILDFSKISDIENKIMKIIERIENFPMFRKPIVGSGSQDCVKINNEKELRKWIQNSLKNENNEEYLIEEFVNGREFTASVCLLADGTWKPIFISHRNDTIVSEAIKLGKPIPFHGDRYENFSKEFPNMNQFVEKIIQAFNPPHPHLLAIQGFQLEKNTDKYYLTELGYRMTGKRGTTMSYGCSGVSMETALISCHLDPNYRAEPDPNRPKCFERHLWYLFRKGILKSHREVPSNAPITSELNYDWFIKPGTQMAKAVTVANALVHITLKNKNMDKILRDMEWLQNNWEPEIEPINEE